MAKMNTGDRLLILKAMDGGAKATSGLIDKRVYSGENKIHAIMDEQTCLWTMKYDFGSVPEPLQQRFTSFSKLLAFATQYFRKRNIEIVEVVNNYKAA